MTPVKNLRKYRYRKILFGLNPNDAFGRALPVAGESNIRILVGRERREAGGADKDKLKRTNDKRRYAARSFGQKA